jgi:hypothetical protein
MAKDKGQVRRVLQILSPEDQETLAILHDPPLMEELLRRQETLAEVKAAGLTGGPNLCAYPVAPERFADQL